MFQKSKTNLLLKILTCFTLLLSLIGAIFSLPSFDKQEISASAETVEYQDLLAVEDRSWGAASDEYYFGGYTIGASTTDNAHWLNTDASVNGCWYNGNDALITANNGVDILKYIYINDTSARDAITANLNAGGTMVGSSGWLANPAASPVYVETTNGSGLLIKILKAYAGESYTLTFKAGFSLIKNDGNVIYVSDDVVYNCVGNVPTRVEKYTVTFNDENGATVSTKRVVSGQAVGELPEVPAKDGYVGFWAADGARITENTAITAAKTATPVYALEYQDLLGLEDRTSWGAHDGEYYFGGVTLEPFDYFNSADSVCNTWYVGNTAPITANNGVDIMEYIYVNCVSARELITTNANGAQLKNDCDCWLSNPAASPVYVETTNGSGIMIRILKSFVGDSFTFTFKAGFSLIRNDGETIYVSNDIIYTYANGTLGGRTVDKIYTLSFDGSDVTKTLRTGDAIGELPEIPAKDGYTGVWTIDGVEITADALYNYGADKTAVVTYSKDITATIGLGDWGVPETESDIRYLWIRDNNAEIATAYPNSYWNDHADNKDSNFGVDIMEYILIDGVSARALINANAAGTTSYTASSTFPLNIGGCYAPVCIETAGDGIRFKVMVDYKTSFKVTFKAGFTLVNADGIKLYTTQDVTYNVGATMGDISKVTTHILTFEGTDETRELENGAVIGDLPEIPEKDGYVATGWAIDGAEITADTVYNYGADKTATPIYVQQYTLSFDGLEDTVTVTPNMEIGELPAVPEEGDYEGVWTIDGVEITANTVYTFGADKTAVAAYKKDISNYIALEDRAWGACEAGGEFYFGVLDKRSENAVVGDESTTYYLNSTAVGCWYVGNNDVITANNGVDIMEYIYLNDTSARTLITENANGAQLTNSCSCWLSNPAASPVCVETTNGSGIMIKVLQAYSGDYFEITFKSGFSLINSEGITVYLSKDVTYKYIVSDTSSTLAKGELTDEDLDQLNGQEITLMNDGASYLVKKTCRLTLPALDPVIVEEGLSQTFVGWTTDANFATGYEFYPAGYKLEPVAAVTLYAVWLGFELQDGAAVRLASGSSGIRFLVDIDKSGYQFGIDNGLIAGVGTFLVPTDYLEKGATFTHSIGAGYYIDKLTETWRVNGEGDTTWTYAAAFVGISEAQYSRKFSARGYLKVNFTSGEGYVYTPYNEEQNARSIYEVASLAYDEYSSSQTIQDYVNKVADITWDGDNFAQTIGIKGNYTITDTDISIDGYTVTVPVNGDVNVSSAVVNGRRLASGTSSNVQIGNLLFSVSGFATTDNGFQFTLGAAENDYDRESDETLYFASSDADLDFFLNDYFKRHSGYVENGENLKVNSVTAGVDAEEFFNHEWMSMSYYWYNSFEGYTDELGETQNRIEGMREVLSNVPVDDYGYVWSSNDRVRDPYTEISTGEQKMGWPFPNNDSVSTAHWEFNGNDSGSWSWSSNVSAGVSGGLYSASVSNQSSNITFTSNSFSSWTSKKIYTFYAPLLEFEVRMDDATNVEDIYVWYTTSSATSFSEDKKVSVNDKAFIKYDYSGKYEHVLYLPMYAESAWGESTSTYVKQLKIEIVLKSGTTMSGNVALNYVRPTLDTRMSNNNSILISSLRTDYDYTGDLDYLTENITRARKAMNFLMQMYDSSRGLKKESYIVGHGGTKESLNWLGNATVKSIASSISQGYWDILYMPEYDFQSNMYFYKALRDMAYLENILAEKGVTVDTAAATVKTATRDKTHGTSAYSYDLATTADTVLTNLRQTINSDSGTGFWDSTQGRFVAGYASGEGMFYDYGYVAWNLEAIYYGIATEEQATAIMSWLSSEETGELYKYEFAPMSNTVTEDSTMLNGEYAAQGDSWVNCQFGGAIMYTSFYDLMARINTLGADNAFSRLQAIQTWYKKVYDYYVANGTDPYEFYRYYYDNAGIQCQGMGTNGAVGLDREFLESFLPVSAVAYGFFGIDSVDGKTIQLAPELPAELTYWEMENLAFNFVKYDLKIYENAIQLINVRGDTTGLKLQVVLDYTAGQTVYVNGFAVTPDKTENGKAYVTVDFSATVVEVR